jgi:hypothetical protein
MPRLTHDVVEDCAAKNHHSMNVQAAEVPLGNRLKSQTWNFAEIDSTKQR